MNLIIGRKPVLEAINSGEELEQIFILYGQQGTIITAIRIAAKKRGIKCTEIPFQKFNSLSLHQNTQGIIAVKSDQKYSSLEELISLSKQKRYPLLLILDSIQDTHNLGAILRSAECAGVDGIILTKYNSAPINETVNKTSAGAISYLKICTVNNLSVSIKQLKENGFWIVGSSLDNSKNYNEVDYKIPVALIVGNEEKGIRKLTADNCDFIVSIPMNGKVQSLNVSVATGILLFEILRQRNI
ncbi:MAG: 23S rRNA (guanosine(2251)-2'-O)-methyltransferase RlmB [Ignavibacteriaceae bacterium]